jgi:AbrB family looped-hinge helix DNA binding protein
LRNLRLTIQVVGKEGVMAHVATLTRKSQITIPAEVRRRLGIGPGDKVVVEFAEDGRAVLVPFRRSVVESMVGLGAELRRDAGDGVAALNRDRDTWDDP